MKSQYLFLTGLLAQIPTEPRVDDGFLVESYINAYNLNKGLVECGISAGYHATLFTTKYVPANHQPWFTKLRVKDLWNHKTIITNIYECTGVFISRKSILMSASCMKSTHHTKHAIDIFVPHLNTWLKINFIYSPHSEYKECTETNCINDIGIVTVKSNINPKFFTPICLPYPNTQMPMNFQLISNMAEVKHLKYREYLEGNLEQPHVFWIQDTPIEKISKNNCKTHINNNYIMETFEENPNHQFFCYRNESRLDYGKETGSIITKKLPGPIPHYTLYGFDHRDKRPDYKGHLAVNIMTHLPEIVRSLIKNNDTTLQFYHNDKHKQETLHQRFMKLAFNHTGYVRLHFETDTHQETCSGVFITKRIIMVASTCVKFTSHFTNKLGYEPQLQIFHRHRKSFVHKSWKLVDGHYHKYRFVVLTESEKDVNPVCIPNSGHIQSKSMIMPGFDATPIYDTFKDIDEANPDWKPSFYHKLIYTECINNMTFNADIFTPDNENAQIICKKDDIQPCVDDRGGPILSLFVNRPPILEGFSFFDHVPCQGPLRAKHYLFKDVKEIHKVLTSLAKEYTKEKIITCEKIDIDVHENVQLENRRLVDVLAPEQDEDEVLVEAPSLAHFEDAMYNGIVMTEKRTLSLIEWCFHIVCILSTINFMKGALRRYAGRSVTDNRQDSIFVLQATIAVVYIVYLNVEGIGQM